MVVSFVRQSARESRTEQQATWAQAKTAKRIALGVFGLGVLLVVAYWFLLFVVTVLKFGEPPSWTYGEGKFCRFKQVAGPLETGELAALLRKEQPEAFNRRRKELGLSDRYLDLKGLDLIGKDLPGVDLSKCVLTGCNFSGCNLRRASFKKSYLAQTTFCGPISVQAGTITPKMARITDLTGSHLDCATFKATVYYWIEMSCIPVDCEPRDLQFCRIGDTTGIADLDPPKAWELPVTVRPTGPQLTPPIGRQVTNAAVVCVPCDNPFRDVPASDFVKWSAMGVDIQKLRAMPACRIDPARLTFTAQTIVNSDSNLVVVIAEALRGMRTVVSAGPLVAMNQARGIRHLVSNSTIWVRDDAGFDNTSVGHPIVLSGARKCPFGRTFLSPTYIWSEGGETGRDWRKRRLESKPIDEVARMLGHFNPQQMMAASPNPGLHTLVGDKGSRQLLGKCSAWRTVPSTGLVLFRLLSTVNDFDILPSVRPLSAIGYSAAQTGENITCGETVPFHSAP